MSLPREFCWTRYGTEAGETIGDIFRRKEEERLANEGVFLWGIGSALKPSMIQLVRRQSSPEVVFTPMKSRPRKIDVEPETVVSWSAGEAMDGSRYEFLDGTIVTGRQSSRSHYALVCSSAEPIKPNPDGHRFSFKALRNLVSGNPVGASQVTAVVELMDESIPDDDKQYVAAFRAKLVAPYFVRLIDPEIVRSSQSKHEIVRQRISRTQERLLGDQLSLI